MPIYSGDINITGSITPSADDTYDAGSPEAAFQDVYVSSGSLWIGDTHKVSIDTDGKLKFRKRKTDAVPAVILAAGGSQLAALAFAGKGSLDKMKLKHWKLYARSLGGDLSNAKTKDIFRIDQTDDYQAESEVAQEDIYTNFKALQGGGELQGISSADSPQFTGLTLTGNLSVSGTTTTIDSTTVSLGDKIITLNAGSAVGDGGIYVNDAATTQTGSLLWDVSADRWIGGLKDSEVTIPTISSTDTLTNKSIDLDSNTLSGTLAEFNTALQSESFVSLTGTETLTNKTLTSPTLTTPALGTPASGTATNITGLPIVAGTTGTLSVARGGTGVTTSTGTGNTVLSASPTFTGTIAAAAGTFSGNVSGSSESTASFGSTNVMGNLNIGTTSSNPSASVATSGSDANLTISGSIFPEGDNNHDLGSANYRWRYIYTTDLKLSNEGTGGNSVDGTEGNWTVEEGEEDLFVTNVKSGKKFRIKLEEIE